MQLSNGSTPRRWRDAICCALKGGREQKRVQSGLGTKQAQLQDQGHKGGSDAPPYLESLVGGTTWLGEAEAPL